MPAAETTTGAAARATGMMDEKRMVQVARKEYYNERVMVTEKERDVRY